MNEEIRLDGRKFLGISDALTASQDDYILGHLRKAGALEVLRDFDGRKRTQEERAEDLLTQILLSGRSHNILAGCLTEEGKTWNRADADANAARFAQITDLEEKTAMRTGVVKFVIGFFSSGVPLSKTSPKSSSRSATAPRTKSAGQST
jgi:hypothetical protein